MLLVGNKMSIVYNVRGFYFCFIEEFDWNVNVGSYGG